MDDHDPGRSSASSKFTPRHPQLHAPPKNYEVNNSKKRRFFAVLHQGVVDSPRKAVRAAVVQDHRTKKI